MNSTELKYNFYSRTLKGGTQTIPLQQQTVPLQQEQVPLQQTQQVPNQTQQDPNQTQQDPNQTQQDPNQTQQQEQQQAQTQVSTSGLEEEGLNQLNQQVPKTKVDFKIATIIGNLDQTLGSKQKINIDNLFIGQLFGSNY